MRPWPRCERGASRGPRSWRPCEDGPAPVQHSPGLGLEFPEREVDRTREMILLELLGAQHLNHLNPSADQGLDLRAFMYLVRHDVLPPGSSSLRTRIGGSTDI
jgi:hypothetical protein